MAGGIWSGWSMNAAFMGIVEIRADTGVGRDRRTAARPRSPRYYIDHLFDPWGAPRATPRRGIRSTHSRSIVRQCGRSRCWSPGCPRRDLCRGTCWVDIGRACSRRVTLVLNQLHAGIRNSVGMCDQTMRTCCWRWHLSQRGEWWRPRIVASPEAGAVTLRIGRRLPDRCPDHGERL